MKIKFLASVFLPVFLALPPAFAAPKNIIILIGDGMGFEQVKAAGMYMNGKAGKLFMETLPFKGRATTRSANDSVTDSAAAATAIATGKKVNNGVISAAIPGDGSDLQTILEYYKSKGKSTGLVTTAYLTHATPAAFAAHTSGRNDSDEIADDMINRAKPEVLLGGGGHGIDTQAAETSGYSVVTDASGLKALDTENSQMVLGYFGRDYMPYEFDGTGALPHLSEMASTALNILDNDPDGLFLMIEGGRIDHAGHDHNIERSVRETAEFSNTVKIVYDWAKKNPETLIIVTADHETGGLTVVNNRGKGKVPEVKWGASGHTGADVPVYAFGDNAGLFGHPMDNTEFFRILTGIK